MSIMHDAASRIARQSAKEHQTFLLISLAVATALLGGMIYFLYSQQDTTIEALKALAEQIKKNDALIATSERIHAEEERVKTLLEDNKGFSIKTYFESLTHDQNMKPEPGWDTETHAIENNDTFDEIVLTAQFKNQTTQSLVAFLGIIEESEIVYIKELTIKKDGPKTIVFELTLATKKRKQFWED